jgi:signal transduction histidine kinase
VANHIDELKEGVDQLSQELEASELRFRNMINNNADGIIIVDSDGIVRFANRAAESLFDRAASDIVGAKFGFPIINGETTEIDVVRRRGGAITAEMRVVETEWEGEAVHLASLRDITDRKRAEQERAARIREQAARQEAEAAGRRFSFLAEASAALVDTINCENSLAAVARLAAPYMADYCIVDLVDEDRSLRQVAVAHADGSKEEMAREMRRRYPFDMDLPYGVSKVLRTGEPEMVSEIQPEWLQQAARDPQHLEMMKALDFRSYMIVPLIARGRKLGAISFVSVWPDRYKEEDLRLAEDVARRMAMAVDNAHLYREAQKANRLKDEFLTTISHELRTPLTALLGWTQLLRSHNFDQENMLYALETIERNAKSQKQIIEDVLDVSTIITGKMRLEIQPVNLAEIIKSAIESVRPAAEAKSIEMIAELENSPGLISGDYDRLQQVIWNLLSNAIRFTPKEGRVTIQLRREKDCAAKIEDVEIIVSDTGQGISREFLPRVFERFLQADGSSTRAYGGLGLGLAIVRHVVEMHGGSVHADSGGEGSGATFTVRLPLR